MLASLLLFGCKQAVRPAKTDKIFSIESTLRLPKGAYPLAEYDRFYVEDGEGYDVVLVSSDGPGHAILVSREHVPFILDGGCSVIRARYSKQTRTWGKASCGGEA
jgi:hypothetical protein